MKSEIPIRRREIVQALGSGADAVRNKKNGAVRYSATVLTPVNLLHCKEFTKCNFVKVICCFKKNHSRTQVALLL